MWRPIAHRSTGQDTLRRAKAASGPARGRSLASALVPLVVGWLLLTGWGLKLADWLGSATSTRTTSWWGGWSRGGARSTLPSASSSGGSCGSPVCCGSSKEAGGDFLLLLLFLGFDHSGCLVPEGLKEAFAGELAFL